MKRRRFFRGTLVTTLFVGLLVAGTTAIFAYYWLQLPNPAIASQRQLGLWLAFREIESEPVSNQIALLDRFEKEILSANSQQLSSEVDAASPLLVESYQEQIRTNLSFLRKKWFTSSVDSFHQLESLSEQTDFLDHKIAVLLHWAKLEKELADKIPTNLTEGPDFLTEVQTWIDQSPPAEKKRMNLVVERALLRWLETYPIDDQSLPTQKKIAREIAEAFEKGFTYDPKQKGYDKAPTPLFLANSQRLFQAWIYELADRFDETAASKKSAFLREKLDLLQRSNLVALLEKQGLTEQENPLHNRPTNPQFGNQSFGLLLEKVQSWIDEAPLKDRPKVEQFINAVQIHLASDFLKRSFFDFGGF
ncbi:MAG: hypothetical protein MPJ24_05950 [Pirellulaceae bacterium]|nr:hypothetical protein [Pirellulaceae bacterium]